VSAQENTVYLGLGSNLGNRAANLAAAVRSLEASGVRVVKQSSIYETEPLYLAGQPWFLNCVVEARTSQPPQELLRTIIGIESALGRERTVRFGPRVIDIDILLYGSQEIRLADLEIPHPRIAERRFVLMPLAEIAPALRHPLLDKAIAELLASTPDRSEVRLWTGEK